ncbi:MAG: hypothetical protein L0K86_01520 [Actinomycetia bacterium]|nr:hypothetical protein [Actinomycetes bacterium]
MTEQLGLHPALALIEARRRARAVDGWGAVWVFPCDRCGYLLESCRCRGEEAIASVPGGLAERRAHAAVGTQIPDAQENRPAA